MKRRRNVAGKQKEGNSPKYGTDKSLMIMMKENLIIKVTYIFCLKMNVMHVIMKRC